MSLLQLTEALHQAFRLLLVLCLPPLGAVLIVSVLAEALRLGTKLRDPAIATIARMAAAVLAIAAAGPWTFAQVARFEASLLALLARTA